MRTLALALCLAAAPAAAQALPDAGVEPGAAPALTPPPATQPTPNLVVGGMTLAQVETLAVQRSRDVIAAKLSVESAEVDRMAAGLLPNPDFSYSFGNIVLPPANHQGENLSPGPFSQGIQTVSVSQALDVWGKRSLRTEAAGRSVERTQALVQDALREVLHTVRSAFEDLLREQNESELSRQTRERYDDTVRLFRARFQAGDVSQAELEKIELESLKYTNTEIDAQMQLAVARGHLASLLAMDSDEALPPVTAGETNPPRPALALGPLTQRALEKRPDVRAALLDTARAKATLAAEKRDPLPDPSLGLAYTHDDFTVSGDNPNTLGLTVSFPIPFFNRNQSGIARANVDVKTTQNASERLALTIRRDVTDAIRKAERSRKLLDAFEGGMLGRAEHAQVVAEKSYRAGALSLLEFLEAQRTFIETRASYLQVQNDYRQALADVAYAVGEEIP